MTEFIMVPVPHDRVQEVYEVLARPRRLNEGSSKAEASSSHSNGAKNWKSIVQKCYRESPPAMRYLLEHLARNAGKEVTSEELADAIGEAKDEKGYTREQLAGVLGAFGRRWKNRYEGGPEHGKWPFDAEPSPEAGMFVYKMSPDMAKFLSDFL